jgi:hypothetical protein
MEVEFSTSLAALVLDIIGTMMTTADHQPVMITHQQVEKANFFAVQLRHITEEITAIARQQFNDAQEMEH